MATLFSDAATPTAFPALTWRQVGAGQAAAFTYDLAYSIVTTRQGNPAWAAQERDGLSPIRSDDKFFGRAQTDPQPDWNDANRLSVPQADEQQRQRRLLPALTKHCHALPQTKPHQPPCCLPQSPVQPLPVRPAKARRRHNEHGLDSP
ncbi:MAG: hypothetical protein RL442_1497 [Pseudomonadota bacterium]